MSTVHQAKIVLGYFINEVPSEIHDTNGFVEEFEGNDIEFGRCTEGDVFGVVIQETEWAETIDLSKLTASPEFIAFIKKHCETEAEPKFILAWDKY